MYKNINKNININIFINNYIVLKLLINKIIF